MSINLITFGIIKQYLERHGSGSGSNIEIESLSITENGTYTASTGYAYNPVSVNVPTFEPAGTMVINENGTFDVTQYSAASVNIPIPPQPSGTLSISDNGMYDVASYASANVNVAGGGGISADDIAMRTLSGAISGSATYLVQNAFTGFRQITHAAFPFATTVGDYAFQYCYNLTSVDLPIVSSLGLSAFQSCMLNSASFPYISLIRNCTFADCRSLETVSFQSATTIGASAFAGCTALTSVDFPSVTNIDASAFRMCQSLSIASFPIAVAFGGNAFNGCYMLVELHLTSISSVPTIFANTFNGTPIGGYSAQAGRYGSVFVPASLYQSFLTAANWSSISSRIVSV